jgi:S-(hydroxymethyl)glutathione dehydrogenase/alcohol dehydrogenase
LSAIPELEAETMKAALFLEQDKPMVIEDISLDAPGDGEVHVKWAATGVCHSDVSIWNGSLPLPPPAILGHEGAGVVAEVGSGVSEFAVGDHVIGSFVPSCGECFYCKNGQAFVCARSLEIGFARMPFVRSDGSRLMPGPGGLSTFAEETVCDPAALVKIPNDFDLVQAALVGCGVTTGVGAALWAAKVREGQTVAVIGCGGVGISVVQGCRIAKAGNIIAIDPNPNKRKAAHEFGATHSVDPSETDVGEYIREMTDGRGADVAFEVVGVPALQRQAYDITRPGGACCWVGVSKFGDEVSIPSAQVALENKSIIGTMYGSANVKQDFVKLIEFVKKGDLELKKMVSRELALEEVNDAFRAMLEGEVIRSVIRYN